MSKKIERELNRALLEKKVANMSVRERDQYADKVLRQKAGKNSNPLRKLLDAQGFNEDGVYLGKRPSQGAGLSDIFNRASSGEITYGSKEKYFEQLDDKIKNLRNELKIDRETKNMGGLLQDDETRIGYANGGGYDLHEDFIDSNDKFAKRMAEMYTVDTKNTKDRDKAVEAYIRDKVKVAKTLGLDEFNKEYYKKEISKARREMDEENNPLLGTRQIKQEGGAIDDQMLMVMTPTQESEMTMESDDDMEEGYTRFIMEEALSEEEEDMLMSKLEQDEELSMLFDKVIDVAQEFAGSGPVNGPGSGVSDSIPARLSDGEFVFTAKAVEEIGEDTLMSMMKDAEAKADERQGLAEGGMLEEEKPEGLLTQSGIVQEDTIAEDELKKRMVQGSASYVRS